MTCEDFERLLPDALGGELTEADLHLLDAHVSQCAACRTEYDSLQATIGRLGELSAPRSARMRREGDRVILLDDTGRKRSLSKRLAFGAFRYAASVLIAFTAGYALHAWLMMADVAKTASPLERQGGRTFQVAVASAHLRNPTGSDLAKCMSAIFDRGPSRQP